MTIDHRFHPEEVERVARVLYVIHGGHRTMESAIQRIHQVATRNFPEGSGPGYVETEGFCVTHYLSDPNDLPGETAFKVTISAFTVERYLRRSEPSPARTETSED